MHNTGKKITALGFLLLAVMPLFFSVGILLKQKIIHFQRKERLEREAIETITISSEKIYWIKPGKEILVDGKFFDVKSFVSEGKTVSLTGFFDDKEDNLVKHMKDFYQDKSRPGNSFAIIAVKFLFTPVYNEPCNLFIENPWHIIPSGFSAYTEVILTGFSPDFTPPPEHC